jgi:hypothetical protein
VSGVSTNFELLPFIDVLQIVIFNQLGVPPNFLKEPRGTANQKSLKNTGVENTAYELGVILSIGRVGCDYVNEIERCHLISRAGIFATFATRLMKLNLHFRKLILI